MKKVLFIILIVIMFVISGMIFWAGLAPQSFSTFFAGYPEIKETANRIGVLNNQSLDSSDATSSEPILGQSGQVNINNNVWDVEIAKNDADRTNGLSNRKVLYRKRGMLFVFDQAANQNFWMKDMLISIDMIFFDSNWKIVEIDNDLGPNTFPKIFGNKVKSRYVLEVNAGEAQTYVLKVGDQAIFLNK